MARGRIPYRSTPPPPVLLNGGVKTERIGTSKKQKSQNQQGHLLKRACPQTQTSDYRCRNVGANKTLRTPRVQASQEERPLNRASARWRGGGSWKGGGYSPHPRPPSDPRSSSWHNLILVPTNHLPIASLAPRLSL
jgi:hypothetical protein